MPRGSAALLGRADAHARTAAAVVAVDAQLNGGGGGAAAAAAATRRREAAVDARARARRTDGVVEGGEPRRVGDTIACASCRERMRRKSTASSMTRAKSQTSARPMARLEQPREAHLDARLQHVLPVEPAQPVAQAAQHLLRRLLRLVLAEQRAPTVACANAFADEICAACARSCASTLWIFDSICFALRRWPRWRPSAGVEHVLAAVDDDGEEAGEDERRPRREHARQPARQRERRSSIRYGVSSTWRASACEATVWLDAATASRARPSESTSDVRSSFSTMSISRRLASSLSDSKNVRCSMYGSAVCTMNAPTAREKAAAGSRAPASSAPTCRREFLRSWAVQVLHADVADAHPAVCCHDAERREVRLNAAGSRNRPAVRWATANSSIGRSRRASAARATSRSDGRRRQRRDRADLDGRVVSRGSAAAAPAVASSASPAARSTT